MIEDISKLPEKKSALTDQQPNVTNFLKKQKPHAKTQRPIEAQCFAG